MAMTWMEMRGDWPVGSHFVDVEVSRYYCPYSIRPFGGVDALVVIHSPEMQKDVDMKVSTGRIQVLNKFLQGGEYFSLCFDAGLLQFELQPLRSYQYGDFDASSK